MISWQRAWNDGLAPLLTDAGLTALRDALASNDPRLIQDSTTFPIPVPMFGDLPVEAACAVSFCLWQGCGIGRVGPLHQAFRRLFASADDLLDEALGTIAFLNWFDATPRDEMRRALLAEIDRQLASPARAA